MHRTPMGISKGRTTHPRNLHTILMITVSISLVYNRDGQILAPYPIAQLMDVILSQTQPTRFNLNIHLKLRPVHLPLRLIMVRAINPSRCPSLENRNENRHRL